MIDQFMDTIVGHKLLSLMDTFSRYNQIWMVTEDEENITFIKERDLYYYKMMPFGIKNVEATYWHLVNKFFNDQIR